jgi:hypothetical protein
MSIGHWMLCSITHVCYEYILTRSRCRGQKSRSGRAGQAGCGPKRNCTNALIKRLRNGGISARMS